MRTIAHRFLIILTTVFVGGCSLTLSLDASPIGGVANPSATNLPGVMVTQSRVQTSFTLSGAIGWQDTGVAVKIGDHVTVTYVSGLWTERVGVIVPHDAAARGGYACGRSDCAEFMPDMPQGALIGRIGSQLVGIGDEVTFVAQDTRNLALRMNDGDAGLYDNNGVIMVQIVVEP